MSIKSLVIGYICYVLVKVLIPDQSLRISFYVIIAVVFLGWFFFIDFIEKGKKRKTSVIKATTAFKAVIIERTKILKRYVRHPSLIVVVLGRKRCLLFFMFIFLCIAIWANDGVTLPS